MASAITVCGIHHVMLTVTDVDKSARFYTTHFGLQTVAGFDNQAVLATGSLVIMLTAPSEPSQAIYNDRFNENRVGLDHLSLMVASHDALVAAARYLDEQKISHESIKDLGKELAIYVMEVRDPDNIQLQLTAPYGLPRPE